jgi:glutathione S-transferase
MPKLHGVPPSPFVRKTRVFLAEKGIPYDLVQVTPMPPENATPEFRQISPLGKIPAYTDGDFAISDSSVICAYLERANPSPALYPGDPQPYARALWFEEYADTRLSETVGPAFFQRVIRKKLFKQDPDEDAVKKALDGIPAVFDYLEGQLGDDEYLVGNRFSIADIAVGSQLAQFGHAGESVDGARWPKLAAHAGRILGRPSFKECIAQEAAIFASM